MPVIVGKSRPLKPVGVKVIKHTNDIEKKYTEMVVGIAKEFGQQSKKLKPKKIIIR